MFVFVLDERVAGGGRGRRGLTASAVGTDMLAVRACEPAGGGEARETYRRLRYRLRSRLRSTWVGGGVIGSGERGVNAVGDGGGLTAKTEYLPSPHYGEEKTTGAAGRR